MKKSIAIAIMMALASIGFSQESIQQPTAINTWDYIAEYGAELPFNKNITLQYDERGNLSYYYHVINYPQSPYTYAIWFTHDDMYADVNDAMGSIASRTRAEVTEYITTPNPHDILTLPYLDGEWYYEILNDDGTVTYQYLQCVGDTTVGGERPKIIVRTNTIYDKDGQQEVTREFVYESDDVVYWWNDELQEFTTLYNFRAEEGDEWEIKVGNESITIHVDAVSGFEYAGQTYKMLHVSDVDNLFSGDIVCGIGHLTSFFPERLMNHGKSYRVEGIRCFWVEGTLLFKYGDNDCDEIYEENHYQAINETGLTESVTVYPNPTDGLLHIVGTGQTEYRITNLLGQTVQSGALDGQTIDVSMLSNGVYFFVIEGLPYSQTIDRSIIKFLINK